MKSFLLLSRLCVNLVILTFDLFTENYVDEQNNKRKKNYPQLIDLIEQFLDMLATLATIRYHKHDRILPPLMVCLPS